MWVWLCSVWARVNWAVMSWLWLPAMAAVEPLTDRPGDDDQFAEWLEEQQHHDRS